MFPISQHSPPFPPSHLSPAPAEQSTHNHLKHKKKQLKRGSKSPPQLLPDFHTSTARGMISALRTCNHFKLYFCRRNGAASVQHEVFNSINHPLSPFSLLRSLLSQIFIVLLLPAPLNAAGITGEHQAAEGRGRKEPR